MYKRITDTIGKYLDFAILLLCLITYIMDLLGRTSILQFITGALGCIYCMRYLIIFFFRPIKRDWLLAKGNFLAKVIDFVLFIPIIVAASIGTYNHFSSNSLSRKELVYDENLYTYENSVADTLGIITCNRTRGHSLAHNDAAETSYAIVRQSNLPDSIAKRQTDPSLLWGIYCHFVDAGNQSMTTTRRGRIISGIVATSGFLLLNGLLISMLISWFDRRREQWLKGEVKYRRFLRWTKKKFYIVIGGNDVAIGFINELFTENSEKELPYIVIQTSRDVDSFRRELFSSLTEEQQRHIIIYYGSRTSKDDIAELYIEKAQELYIIGEDTRTDDIESYHDTINMKCVDLIFSHFKETEKGKRIKLFLDKIKGITERISQIKEEIKAFENKPETDTEKIEALKKEKNRLEEEKKKLGKEWKEAQLKCYVMFEYQTTFSVFQFYDINDEVNAYIDFKPFNYYEVWAQKVLINKEIFPKKIKAAFEVGGYLPLEGADGIKEHDDSYVHLFVVGMSRIGVAMAIEAAHLCHYPNYENRKIRTKITFIDKNTTEEKDFVMGRFKELFELSHWRYGNIDDNGALEWNPQDIHIPVGFDYLGGDFLDIEWEFVNGGIETAAVQNYILKSANQQAKVTIAICLPESNRSHAAALFLDKRIYSSDSVLQVLAYNRYGNSVVRAISDSGPVHPYCGKLRHFGDSSIGFLKNMKQSEEIGRKIDAAYSNMRVATLYNPDKTKYKGKSAVANLWSSIYCGNTMWTKLRSIDFNPITFLNDEKVIALLANVEHNRWNIEELMMNFRPLTQEEQEREIALKNKNKNILKGRMAHTDICSNKRLKEIDNDSRKYDIALTECLYEIFYNHYIAN